VGHCFSPLLGGKGGKGVATTLGVYLILVPRLVLIAVLVFGATLWLTRVPALGSLAAVATLVGILLARGDTPTAVLGCVTFALLVYTHRSNLGKLTSARR
jgi:acyl phosphate:glycerol-3-phosphate acyltransferase